MSNNDQERLRPDREEIERFLRVVVPEDGIVEIRTFDAIELLEKRDAKDPEGDPLGAPIYVPKTEELKYQRRGATAGYFSWSNLEAAALAAASLNHWGAASVYCTMHELPPDLLARAANRLDFRGKATGDADVLNYRFFAIDIDAPGPEACMATEEERLVAGEVSRQVAEYLADLEFPAPLSVDSGNGCWLVYALDPLPVANAELYKVALQALRDLFPSEKRTIDTAVTNPSRLFPIVGTVKRKGDHCPDIGRPWRMVRLLELPDGFGERRVTRDMLGALAKSAGSETPTFTDDRGPRTSVTDGAERWHHWIERNGVPVLKRTEKRYGTVYVLGECLEAGERHRGKCSITIFPSGAITAGCHHSDCHWTWRDLRERYEPGAYAAEPYAEKTGGPDSGQPSSVEHPEEKGAPAFESDSEASSDSVSLQTALLAIADACDGAKSRDGMGFNRNDSPQGKHLADKARRGEPWSAAESKDAFRMCCYYWKQLRKLGINSELIVDPAVEEGSKALRALEEAAKETPIGAIQAVLENSETVADLAALRTYERERFEAGLLNLRELGAKAREIRALEQAVTSKGKKTRRKRSGGGSTQGEEDKYEITPAGIVWQKDTPDGAVSVPLTNFAARIVTQIVRDDGVETQIHLEIEAELKGRKSTFSVPADQYSTLNWVIRDLGPEAIVYPGHSVRDRARVAIQVLSGDIASRHIYAHTGWRKLEDRWMYLHAGGAIGPIGPEMEIEVSLEDTLREVVLPAPPEGEALAKAVDATLRLLDLGRPEVVLVGLCCVWRSVLGEASPVDFTVHVAGQTGVFKSELAALFQGFFGAGFNSRRLPGSFKSTANANERLLSGAKDMLFVVDDFAPCGTTSDVARLHRDADSLLRGVGNRSGRRRLRADGTLRPTFTPRGLPVTTGEDIPQGHSLRARMLVLEVGPGDIESERLAECQADRDTGLYAEAMSAFLKWLSPRMDELKEALPARQEELRKAFLHGGLHRRVPDIAASLMTGFEVFLDFVQDAGTLSVEETEQIMETAREALSAAAQAQKEYGESQEPASRFLALLVAALASGRCHLEGSEAGTAPKGAEEWGWRQETVGIAHVRRELKPQGACVGWLDGDDALLDPESAFAAAQRLAVDQGTSLPVTARTLWKRLAEGGYLASRDLTRGRNLVRRSVAGKRREVLHLCTRTLTEVATPMSGPIGPIGPGDSSDNDLGRDRVGRNVQEGELPSQPSAPEKTNEGSELDESPEPRPHGGPDGPIGPGMEERVL